MKTKSAAGTVPICKLSLFVTGGSKAGVHNLAAFDKNL